MKKMGLLLIASMTALVGSAHAATLAAQSLKCGGVATIESERGKTVLDVYKVGNDSTCDSVAIKSLNVDSRIDNRNGLTVALNPQNLGNQLVLQVTGSNGTEVVILEINKSSTAAPTTGPGGTASGGSMSEYERKSLEIQQQREAREKAKRNAEAAGVIVGGAGALGGAVIEGLGGIER